MAEFKRTTKGNSLLSEKLKLLGVGQHLSDPGHPVPRVRLEFERENGTKMSVTLYGDEIEFLKKEIHK